MPTSGSLILTKERSGSLNKTLIRDHDRPFSPTNSMPAFSPCFARAQDRHVIRENFGDRTRYRLLEEEGSPRWRHVRAAFRRFAPIDVSQGKRTASHVLGYNSLVDGAAKNQPLLFGYQVPSASPSDRDEVVSHHFAKFR